MSSLRCHGCSGSGYVLGGGMIRKEHDECNGTGKVNDFDKLATNNLMEKFPGLTENQAMEAITEAKEQTIKKTVLVNRRRGRPARVA